MANKKAADSAAFFVGTVGRFFGLYMRISE